MMNGNAQSVNSNGELKKVYRTAVIITVLSIVYVFMLAGAVTLVSGFPWIMENFGGLGQIQLLRVVLFVLTAADFAAIFFVRKKMLTTTKTGRLSQRLFAATIITAALCLSITIYGLVLFIEGLKLNDLYILSALSVLSLVVFFPRYEHWEELQREYDIKNLATPSQTGGPDGPA